MAICCGVRLLKERVGLDILDRPHLIRIKFIFGLLAVLLDSLYFIYNYNWGKSSSLVIVAVSTWGCWFEFFHLFSKWYQACRVSFIFEVELGNSWIRYKVVDFCISTFRACSTTTICISFILILHTIAAIGYYRADKELHNISYEEKYTLTGFRFAHFTNTIWVGFAGFSIRTFWACFTTTIYISFITISITISTSGS